MNDQPTQTSDQPEWEARHAAEHPDLIAATFIARPGGEEFRYSDQIVPDAERDLEPDTIAAAFQLLPDSDPLVECLHSAGYTNVDGPLRCSTCGEPYSEVITRALPPRPNHEFGRAIDFHREPGVIWDEEMAADARRRYGLLEHSADPKWHNEDLIGKTITDGDLASHITAAFNLPPGMVIIDDPVKPDEGSFDTDDVRIHYQPADSQTALDRDMAAWRLQNRARIGQLADDAEDALAATRRAHDDALASIRLLRAMNDEHQRRQQNWWLRTLDAIRLWWLRSVRKGTR